MQTAAVILEPAVGDPAIRFIYLVEQSVESPTMIHMSEMGHFMRHHRPAHMRWCHDQPPVQPDRLATGAAAPAPPGIANREPWANSYRLPCNQIGNLRQNHAGLGPEQEKDAGLDLSGGRRAEFRFHEQGEPQFREL